MISGDLTGYIRYTGNILSYTTMTAPIANHLLAGFGNHDADTSQKINQTWLNQNIVKHHVQWQQHLYFIMLQKEKFPSILEIDQEFILCNVV